MTVRTGKFCESVWISTKDRWPRLPSIAVINIMTKSDSGRKEFISAFSFQFSLRVHNGGVVGAGGGRGG